MKPTFGLVLDALTVIAFYLFVFTAFVSSLLALSGSISYKLPAGCAAGATMVLAMLIFNKVLIISDNLERIKEYLARN